MMEAGIGSKIVCLDPSVLDERFLAQDWDKEFLKALPKNIDLCEENGEFHSYCYHAPLFNKEISIRHVINVTRKGFCSADFI